MLGSQILDRNLTFEGRDFRASEVNAFGYCHFEKAVHTGDAMGSHSGAEVVLILQGEACWECGDDTILRATGGQAIFLPACVRHKVADGVYPPCQTLWIAFNSEPKAGQQTLLSDEDEVQFYRALPSVPIVRDIPSASIAQALEFARMLQNPSARSGSRLIMSELRSRLYSLVVELWRICEESDRQSSQSQLVREAATMLRKNIGGNINVSEIADMLGYSRGHLHATFRKEMGMSPTDYQRRIRLKLCCDRLIRSEDSITAIAYDLGFSSSQHLSRVFRTYLGITPSAYRQEHQSPPNFAG